MIKKLIPYLKSFKKSVILAPLFVIIEVIFEVIIPLVMAKIVDIGIKNKDIKYIAQMGMIMAGLAILSLICGWLSAKHSALAGAGFGKEIRKALFHKMQDFSSSNMDKFGTASLLTRITTDVLMLQNAFMMSTRLLFRAPLMLILAVIMSVSINAELSLIFLIAVPILAALIIIIAKKAFPLFRQLLKKYDRMNSVVQENLIGIRVVKSFVREEYESKNFHDIAEELRESQLKAERLFVLILPAMQFVIYGCMLSIAWFGGNKIIAGTMDPGEMMSFLAYVGQILFALIMTSMIFINLVNSKAGAARIIEVLDEKPEIIDKSNPVTIVRNGSIEFKNVYFSYGKETGNMVLSDINFTINSGEIIGIIGGTGSAKTSLVQLIPRLYDVSNGSVMVGGLDVREYSLKALRDSVSIVLQKNTLFSGAIKENLKWGNPEATDEEIYTAARAAQAHEFIISFPDGYDTILEQGGVNLSGGQKQRLTIARALLKKPKIIIMDDSTSAVDISTDSKIRKGIKEFMKDVTAITIAQRITSVMDADRIIVLEDGKIHAIGTHEQLLKSSHIYKEVFESQQKGGIL
jgi:ATP-binding cassette subfamily B multidrug efflux pump